MAVARPFEAMGERLNGTIEEARGVAGGFGEIADDLRQLARAEARLAAAETKENLEHGVKAALSGAIALTFLYLTLAFAALTGVFALDTVMPLWAAALIVTGVLLMMTAIAGLLARNQARSVNPVPQKTISTIQEDLTWARSQMKLRGR